jgi:hypothetical protein
MKKIHLIFIAFGLIAVTSFSSALNARGSTVTLCANTKSGALRYIKSGNCKSSENKLEIDQNGEVGQTGPQGPAGPAGPAGADGSNGADGSSALSFFLQDSVGAKFIWTGQYILWNGFAWNYGWDPNNQSQIAGGAAYYYLDASCSTPIFPGSGWAKNVGVQSAVITTSDLSYTGTIQSGWKRKGPLLAIDPSAVYYRLQSGVCNPQSGTTLMSGALIVDYYEAEPMPWPVIVPPVSLVQGS